jgi:hypothetical protein
MSKRRLIGFAPIVTVATLSLLPALAQAAPQFHSNGVLAGASKQSVVQFGTITMKNPFFGEIKCHVLVGAPVANESEKGVAPVEGWETSGCQMPECHRGQVSVMAESPPHFSFIETTIKVVERGEQTVPWPAELTAPEGRTSLRIPHLKIWITCPGEGFEVAYEGELVPHYVNGSKNGLHPSHLEFEGEGGKTGHLITKVICGGECAEADVFVSGELTTLGTSQQLITAE